MKGVTKMDPFTVYYGGRELVQGIKAFSAKDALHKFKRKFGEYHKKTVVVLPSACSIPRQAEALKLSRKKPMAFVYMNK